MRVRTVALLWLVAGVIVWNAFFDLYISRGAREYLQKNAEHESGLGPPVTMDDVMRRARHDGLVMSTVWSGLIVVAGWLTIAVVRRAPVAPGTGTEHPH